ncbi:hypothetical protein HZC32_01840 [Candidatus Woesearchaeota archaeon]|nr:hypothetical protein [Candidatus Woesearchaeota archaeon]
MAVNKRSQIEVTFNWVYILIAGAVILLFFIGIIIKQRAVSEENIHREVLQKLETIFAAARVSEDTKYSIDASGLADYTLYFNCEEGITRYGIKDAGLEIEDAVNPLFAPAEISSPKLITWSMPYKLPFKVTDLFFVIPANTEFFVLGENKFAQELLNATREDNDRGTKLNINPIKKLDDIAVKGKIPVKIIDTEGNSKIYEKPIPPLLSELENQKVTLVSFIGPNQDKVNYYGKEGATWVKLNSQPLSIISFDEERETAKYAAIFSGGNKMYGCEMYKTIKRLSYLNEIYAGKLAEMSVYYEKNSELLYAQACKNTLTELKDELQSYQLRVKACLASVKDSKDLSHEDNCIELIKGALALNNFNTELSKTGDCITLY